MISKSTTVWVRLGAMPLALSGAWGAFTLICDLFDSLRFEALDLFGVVIPAFINVLLFCVTAAISVVASIRQVIAVRGRSSRPLWVDRHLTLFFTTALGFAVGFSLAGLMVSKIRLFFWIFDIPLVGVLHLPAFAMWHLWLSMGVAWGDECWTLVPWAIVCQWAIIGVVIGFVVETIQRKRGRYTHPDAAATSCRAGQLPASPETRSSDSQRTHSPGSCG